MIEKWKDINIWADTDIEYDKRTGVKMIRAPYPAWYNRRKLEDMEAERSGLEGRLRADIGDFSGDLAPIPGDSAKADVRSNLRHIEAKIDAVKSSKPKLSVPLEDRLIEIRKKMGDRIGESMFSKTAQWEGYPDPYKEATRMKSAVIPIDNDIIQWMQKCNQPFDGGTKMASRDALSVCWQIASEYFGEDTKTESLRPSDPYDGRPTKKDVMVGQDGA